jgi:hypothetical protein
MAGVAKILFDGGARLMPAQNQYDRELVFEEAEFFARRHGRATLELGRRAMSIRLATNGETCSTCMKALGSLIFAVGVQQLCRRCARRASR